MRIKLLSLVLAVAAIAAPAANAQHAPGEDVRAAAPKHVAASPAPATIVKVVNPGGFDWDDAAVGAGVAVFVLGGAAGLTLLGTRRRLRPV
jgi:ABC-type proline/glycine betaine transport system substrate-binding protein